MIIDGFKIPETPQDILENRVRVPDYITLDYIYGLTPDYNITELMFDVTPDKLVIYNQNQEFLTEFEYSCVNNLSFFRKGFKLEYFPVKMILSVIIGGLFFGIVGAMLGAILFGLEPKNTYSMCIDFTQDGRFAGLIHVTGEVELLEKLKKRIVDKKDKQNIALNNA